MHNVIALRTSQYRAWSLLVLLALILATPAGAANLVTNGTFNDNINGWTPYGGNASWDPTRDVNGALGSSGSLQLETWITNNGSTGPFRCIPISAPGTYQGSTWTYVPSAQTQTPYPQLDLESFSTGDCTGSYTGDNYSTGFIPTDAWTQVQTSIVSSALTQSVRIRLLSGQTSTSTHVFAYFDDVSLVPEPDASLLSIAALGAIAALAVLRKRGRPQAL